jgi:hypothetical protein
MKKFFKFFLYAIFFSYYFVAIALNFPRINAYLNPLEILHLSHVVKKDDTLFLGTYPNATILETYKNKYHVERIITMLDPDFPISRELIKEEKKLCKEMGIELIIIPIGFYSKNLMDYIIVRDILDDIPKITLIHNYYFDARMKLTRRLLLP